MQNSAWRWKSTSVALSVAALLLVPGCMRVVRQESPYYIKGPHQIEPPDGYFSAGKKVLVFGEKDSYSRVLTFDGIAAHIWQHDLLTLSQWKKEQQGQETKE